MAFYISTTGTLGTVTFPDLGDRSFTHPTTNFNLEKEFPIFEILTSTDLKNAIDSDYITVSDAIADGNQITDLQKYYMTRVVYDGNGDDVVDNASELGGFSASYYTDSANLTGTINPSVLTNSGAVESVNGATGTVVLTSTNISEGTNLYYTDSRSRGAIGVSASSGNYLSYDSVTGLFNLSALAITDVTVDTGVTFSADAYFGANYTGSEFQEGDTVVLANLTDGPETYMHNGGTAGTINDFVRIQSPDLSDSYIRSLFSGTTPLTYETSTGGFSISKANGSGTDGYLASEDFATFSSKYGGSGTTDYLSRFLGTSTIGDSIIRDDGTTLGVGTAPASNYLMSLSTSTITNSFSITNSTDTVSTSNGVFVNNFGNLGNKIGVQAIANSLDSDNYSIAGVFSSSGASFTAAANKQYGIIVSVDANQGFTHDSIGVEVQANDSHNGDTYGMVINTVNAGTGSSYIGQFNDGRTTVAGRFLRAIDSNGTVEWADVPGGTGGVDSVNGATGTVVLTTTDISEGTNLYYTDTRSRLALSGGDGINFATASGIISADIQDSATSSTTALWSANKIYTELQAVQSKQTWTLGAASSRTLVTDTYLNQFDSLPTNLTPYVAYKDSKIVNMSVATENAETWIAEVRVNDITTASYSVTSGDSGFTTLDVNVNQGDKISFYCNGTDISRPSITILMEEI